MDKRLLTAEELGQYISKSIPAIYTMVSRRQIPFVRLGRLTRFDVRAIDKWLESQSIKPLDI